MPFPDDSVREIMSDRVLGIQANRSVSEILRIASDYQVHHFPVFDAYRLVGFVCTCDLRNAPLDSLVSKWMHTDVAEVPPETDAREAGRIMNSLAVGSLLVRDARGIRGIVTRGDLIERALLDEPQCAFCHGHQHLRAGSNGQHTCVDCQERSCSDEWFEVGPGD